MPAKAPIYLKSGGGKNGAGTGKGGKKLRELLSAEMISLPLGDFRHMAHVGRGGDDDMFGDTAFLKHKGGSETSTDGSVEGTQTLGRVQSKKRNKKSRNHSVPDGCDIKSTHSHEVGCGPMDSPVLQTAFSLPALNHQSTSTPSSPRGSGKEGKRKKMKKSALNNNCITNGKSRSHEAGLDAIAYPATPNGTINGPAKPRRLASTEEANGNGHIGNGIPAKNPTPPRRVSENPVETQEIELPNDTTSLDDGWALDLDLGSSLMDDVMGIMDKIEL
ncbi:uncharacterized protein LOC143463257 [Clavelina lepadiformis]|uniref:uncharacterized protein LOC143463257 n=1 Tax=Clavelina lepadiformis TaxID=159417 RepID=UPI0040428195